jgi:hypothetical protein
VPSSILLSPIAYGKQYVLNFKNLSFENFIGIISYEKANIASENNLLIAVSTHGFKGDMTLSYVFFDIHKPIHDMHLV